MGDEAHTLQEFLTQTKGATYLLGAFFLIMVTAFFLADFFVRILMAKRAQRRRDAERQKALEFDLNLDVSEDTPSLKRVQIDDPRAQILAVDDESIVLDSFRKILVMAGYSVDTVESGQEALNLIQKNGDNYDFLFTDLKMPTMNGVDVVKGAHHLNPNIDIIVITGQASIQSAVECMRYGTIDYVEKPFTSEELEEAVATWCIRRKERTAPSA